MRNYIILNGNNSNTISGLLIQSLPPISKPLMRTAIEEIDGRDGDIVTNLGYSAYDKEVSIGLYGSYDVDEVIKYFNDNMTGQVTFSNEPDKYYNYEIINQIDFERLIRFKTAIVTLHCQPFKYPTEETPVEINIQNITNEAEEMDLDNTSDAPMKLELKGNTSQASDPTPDSPVDVNVVSGDNTIEICAKNLFDGETEVGAFDSNGAKTTGTSLINKNMIRVSPSTTYRISNNGSGMGVNILSYQSDKTYIGASQYQFYESFTTSSNTYYINFWRANNLDTIKIQLEQGNTISNYEAYTGNSQLISLGVENLVNNTLSSGIYNGITYVVNQDKSVTISGTATAITWLILNSSITLEAGTYTMSSGNTSNTIRMYCGALGGYTSGGILTKTLTSTQTSDISINIPNGTAIDTPITIYPMVEKGSKANSYSPYGTTPIELCSSSDGTKKDGLIYDLSTDKLYKYSEIGKAVLDGTQEPSLLATLTTVSRYVFNNLINSIGKSQCISNYFTWRSSQAENGTFNNEDNEGIHIRDDGGGIGLKINTSTASTTTALKTWLSTHNTDVYYVLATPTTIEIDNDKLKQQVKALYQNAKSYDPITHITQNANDKPFILNATAVQKGTDTATVDNDGNIYSKPTLDIEGNGIVAIYLNGNQMFSVDLSNSSECIIDVTNLEAYDPETNELMNRQVTGDYSKFILPVGENQVKVSGNVTKTTITDYVRWL